MEYLVFSKYAYILLSRRDSCSLYIENIYVLINKCILDSHFFLDYATPVKNYNI